MINIIKYREAAFTYLTSRVASLYYEIDELLDRGLRLVSDLPLKPAEDDTYNNIVGIKPVVEQRLLCLKLLQERLNKSHPQTNNFCDDLLDKCIRLLNKLPDKPNGNLPYVALFTLEEEKRAEKKDYNLPSFYKTNQKGIQLMHSFEGLVLKAYKDPGSADGKPYTIG